MKNFPAFEDFGVRGTDIGSAYPDLDVRGGILQGYNQEQEQYNEIDRRQITAPERETAAFGHGALNKRRPGVKELADLAKISYLANAQFAKGLLNVYREGHMVANFGWSGKFCKGR